MASTESGSNDGLAKTVPASQPFVPNISGKIINIRVTNGKVDTVKDFSVHSSVLQSAKAIVARIERSTSQSVPSSLVELGDVAPSVFEVYVQWLYTRVLPTQVKNVEIYIPLARGYVLGQSVGDHEYMQAMIDQIIYAWETWGLTPRHRTVGLAYKNTASGSALRRIILDLHLYGPNIGNLDYAGRFHPEFVNEYIIALRYLSESSREGVSLKSENYAHHYVQNAPQRRDVGGSSVTKSVVSMPSVDLQTIPDEEDD